MKKILFALVLVFVGLFAFGCGGNNGSDKLKVGLIVSAAGPNDNGYNQFAIEGLRQAERDFDITQRRDNGRRHSGLFDFACGRRL